MSEGVYWECWIRNTKAAKIRLFDAASEMGLLLSFQMRFGNPCETSIFLARIKPEDRDRFIAKSKLEQPDRNCKWHPQRYFHNSTLIPVYDSPEDEMKGPGHESKGYKRWAEARKARYE